MNTGSLIFFANYIPSNFNKKLSCFFDFENTGNYIVSSIGKDKNIITGYILPSTGDFWNKKENNGFISGNYIKLENIENASFNFKDFTCIFSVEKANFDGGVLLSSLEKTTGLFLNENNNYINKEYYKGFEFGITANNYLYFEYFKNDSPACIVGQNKVNDKASIYLSINNNIINYGFVDFSKKILVNTNSIILGDYLFDQKNLYIGYNPKATGLYSNNKNYIGYIENIILSSPCLINYEILNVASGFIYNFESSSSYVYSSITTGITGTYSSITGYNTEITGYERIATGFFTNPWGISVMGYITQPLIRQIPLSGIFNLSGEIINIITGYSGVQFSINNDKFLSYQKNVVNILNKIDSQDYIETKFLNDHNNKALNKKNIFIEYDRVSNSYQNPNFAFYNVFANGQLQKSGSFNITTDPYNKNIKIIENDYGIDPLTKQVVFNNFYGLAGQSSIFTDMSLSESEYLGEIEDLNMINFNNNDLFLNGQKLYSGIHYNLDQNFLLKQKITGISIINNIVSNNNSDIFVAGSPGENKVFIYTGNNNIGWSLKQILSGEFEVGGYSFGESVSISNNNIIIATDTFYNNSRGIACVYTGDSKNGWNLKQKISGMGNPLLTLGDDASAFGFKTDISNNGDIIIITDMAYPIPNGSSYTSIGAVYIYTGNSNTGWSLKQKITGNYLGGHFGTDAKISKNGLVLTASDNFSNYLNGNGYVNIYTGNSNDGWNFKQQITTGSNINTTLFGNSINIDLSGQIIAVGAPIDTNSIFYPSGSVFIYTGNSIEGWKFKQKITGDNLNFNFGKSISINNDNSIIVVGANFDRFNQPLTPNNINRGGIFIFTGNINNGWSFYQKISGENPNTELGYFISIQNNQNIIFTPGLNSGFIFTKNNIIFDKNLYLSGSLISINSNYDYKEINSGISILSLKKNFYQNNSEIYINGIRQTLNYDYLELSKFDITTGIKILLENNKDYIYNNEGFIK